MFLHHTVTVFPPPRLVLGKQVTKSSPRLMILIMGRCHGLCHGAGGSMSPAEMLPVICLKKLTRTGGRWGGSVGWASDFCSGHDPKVVESSPTSGLALSVEPTWNWRSRPPAPISRPRPGALGRAIGTQGGGMGGELAGLENPEGLLMV